MIFPGRVITPTAFIFICILLSSCLGHGRWQRDVEIEGIRFKKIRSGESGIIGRLSEDTTIQGYPCKKGWVHFYNNQDLKSFTLERPMKINNIEIPASTWVTLNEKGALILCAFPCDMEIQGHMCRGTGGPKGVQVSFYENGALKIFFSPETVVIQGVPCKGGVFNYIELHENGDLKACTLSGNTVINGVQYDKGERVRFDEKGRHMAL